MPRPESVWGTRERSEPAGPPLGENRIDGGIPLILFSQCESVCVVKVRVRESPLKVSRGLKLKRSDALYPALWAVALSPHFLTGGRGQK